MKANTPGIALEDSRHKEERQPPKVHEGQVYSTAISSWRFECYWNNVTRYNIEG